VVWVTEMTNILKNLNSIKNKILSITDGKNISKENSDELRELYEEYMNINNTLSVELFKLRRKLELIDFNKIKDTRLKNLIRRNKIIKKLQLNPHIIPSLPDHTKKNFKININNDIFLFKRKGLLNFKSKYNKKNNKYLENYIRYKSLSLTSEKYKNKYKKYLKNIDLNIKKKNEEFNKESDIFVNKLTENELEAFKLYTGDYYKKTNMDSIISIDIEGTINYISLKVLFLIKNSFKKANKTKKEIRVFRGVSMNNIYFDKLHKGDEFINFPIMSTSLNPLVATSVFYDKEYPCCIFEIIIPKGIPYIHINDKLSHHDETEILLPPNTMLKVLKKKTIIQNVKNFTYNDNYETIEKIVNIKTNIVRLGVIDVADPDNL